MNALKRVGRGAAKAIKVAAVVGTVAAAAVGARKALRTDRGQAAKTRAVAMGSTAATAAALKASQARTAATTKVQERRNSGTSTS